MTYSVEVGRAAQRQLKKLPSGTKSRIARALRGLEVDPRSQSVKLAGEEVYRKRVGDFRIVFVLDDTLREVFVTRVRHRREVYRRRR